jgi:hypothetical protein
MQNAGNYFFPEINCNCGEKQIICRGIEIRRLVFIYVVCEMADMRCSGRHWGSYGRRRVADDCRMVTRLWRLRNPSPVKRLAIQI